MVSRGEQKLILVVMALVQVSTVVAIEECTLSNRQRGVCVPLISCERDKDAVIFASDFCSEDFSEICCENIRARIALDEPTTKSVIKTKESRDPFDFESFESFKLFRESECGKLVDSDRISNGRDAGLFEFPWNALIGIDDQPRISFVCGGTLITANFVLTAAHCLVSTSGRIRRDLKLVRLGEHRISTVEDCNYHIGDEKSCADPVQDITVDSSSVIVHPDFSYLEKANDIGLIRLSRAAKINQNNIQPICLPLQRNLEALPTLPMTVIGYGSTESNAKNSDVLQKVGVKVASADECAKKFRNANLHFNVAPNQFCAGDTKDSCRGDSGSSIQFPHKGPNSLRYIQFGIVSFGHNVCGSELPGVYTKVYPYLPWILDNVK